MRPSMIVMMLAMLATCCPPLPDKPTTPAKTVTKQEPPPKPAEPPAVAVAGPPVARTVAVVDKEFGLEVADPYRWMEGQSNTEHDAWLVAQGEYAAKELAKIPDRDKLYARLRELVQGVTGVYNVQLGGKRMLHYVLPAGAQLPKLAVREHDGTTRILVDPEKLATEGTHASLDAYSVSPDGERVAYIVSKGGGEAGEIHIMDIATGKDLPDVIERIWGEFTASWTPDGKSFFYTQMAVPQPGVDAMANMVVRFHVLGQPVANDVTIIGRNADTTWKLAPEEFPIIWMVPGSTWMIASAVGARSEGRFAVAKLAELDKTGASKTPWRVVSEYSDQTEWVIPRGDRLYVQTYKDAPNRKIVSVPLAKPDLKTARLEIAEDPNAKLTGMWPAKDAMYVLHLTNGLARLSRWTWQGKPAPLALPYEGWASDLASDPRRDGLVFALDGWLRTGTYYAYDPKTKQITPTGLASSATADVSQIVAEEVEVESHDAVKVPLSILRRKDIQLDGSRPTILYGYGAYGATETPSFSASRVAWIERGGVYAIAHVRGSGAKGRKWQDDGSREHKMRGIRDFIACGEYLVAKKYTSPAKLAVHGISMGGILVGRAITERPDLFAAAQLEVGSVNPLRILVADNGPNQKGELGDPATEGGYKSILEMDPYHHVKPGTDYPAVIFTIGLNDRRVAPWMTSKMAARMQAASKRPVLVRVDANAGHGVGSTRDQTAAQRADAWSFFLQQFGEAGAR